MTIYGINPLFFALSVVNMVAKLSGVTCEKCSAPSLQQDLFADTNRQDKSAKLMKTLDEINGRFGRDSLICASSGFDRKWAMKCGNRSPRYTTNWAEIPSLN